jgi:Rrf2 family protein
MMVVIARQAGVDSNISLNDVAERTAMSRRYLEQLAIGLKESELILGRAGKGGGYRLLRPAAEISTQEIIEAVIGPINVVECVGQPEICELSEGCECRRVYQLVNQQVTEVLGGVSLADLTEDRKLTRLVRKSGLETFEQAKRQGGVVNKPREPRNDSREEGGSKRYSCCAR